MPAPSARSLLIIEDDSDLRLTLEYFLGKIGYTVLTARDCEEGIRICMEKRPRAVLLDIMLPGMDGYEACTRIKGDPITQHIPVIFITGKKASEVHLKGSKACADFWISKPVDPNDVGADLYFLFEKEFDLSLDDLKHLRVARPIPKLTGSTLTAYQAAGMEPSKVHFGDTHTHVTGEIYHEAYSTAHSAHASPPPAPPPPPQAASAPSPPSPPAGSPSHHESAAELKKVQNLLFALRDSLRDTSSRLDAILQYIDVLDK